MEPAGFSLREPERRCQTEMSSGASEVRPAAGAAGRHVPPYDTRYPQTLTVRLTGARL